MKSWWVITGVDANGKTEEHIFDTDKYTKQQVEEVADGMVKRGLKSVTVTVVYEEQ
jgi:hypothetical protein